MPPTGTQIQQQPPLARAKELPTLTPVEELDPKTFRPPLCPWPQCSAHRRDAPIFHYQRFGWFRRKLDGRRVPRFRCGVCRRTFSQQTFAFSYYLKRPALSAPIAAGLVAGCCHRQLGRSLACSHTTVTKRSARLGRHALLLHELCLSRIQHLSEPVVIDDFETFTGCQDFPCGIGTAVGQRSQFVLSLSHAPHGRGGKLNRFQRRKRDQRERRFGRPPRGSYQRAFRRHLELLLAHCQGRLRLVTDGHSGYKTAIRRHPQRERIEHQIYPNPPRGPKGAPSSPAAILRDRAMFAVDLLHKLLRHSQAHHRRETSAFSRRDVATLERGFLAVVWRNLVKPRSERKANQPTPAMTVGMARRRWTWRDVLARRLQPSLVPGQRWYMDVYRREIRTPMLTGNPQHQLKNAF